MIIISAATTVTRRECFQIKIVPTLNFIFYPRNLILKIIAFESTSQFSIDTLG